MRLLFYDIAGYEMKCDNTEYKQCGNKQNLIRPQLLKVFSNVHEILLQAGSFVPDDENQSHKCQIYPFSIISLLEVVGDTKVNKIEIRVERHKDLNMYGWLGEQQSSTVFPSIIKKCQEMNFKHKFEMKEFYGSKHLVLSISRKCDK